MLYFTGIEERKCFKQLKGNSRQEISVANMIELLLNCFLVYHSPMFEAQKVPERPVEVSCDITQHLVAYRASVEPECVHIPDNTHGYPVCIHYFFAELVVRCV